jgi:serine/threonine protein kinase
VRAVIAAHPSFEQRYALRAVVGWGAMGVVFEATRLTSDQRVAIKFMSRIDEPELLARFVQE